MHNIEFKLAGINEEIYEKENQLLELYRKNDFQKEAEKLKEDMDSTDEYIRITFIGQYTAGKSTIISALTNNKHIKINSDIETSDVSDYKWNSVMLTDTPGLYTNENVEHDNKTIDMIKKSDLIVYCITSDLFNKDTLKDFKNWIYDKDYIEKMYLVINKMSKEAGEYDELVKNYSETINEDLYPHSIDDFYCSFIDAKDYKDGVEENDDELIDYSHFNDFISRLNEFIDQKGLLGKLNTPIQIMKDSIDSVCEKTMTNQDNKEFNLLLSQIEREIENYRREFSIESRNIVNHGLKQITDKGSDISKKIGEESIEFLELDLEELIKDTCCQINNEIQELWQQNYDDFSDSMNKVLEDSVAGYFVDDVNPDYNDKISELENNHMMKIKGNQIKSIGNIVDGFLGEMYKSNGKIPTKYFLKSREVANTKMHDLVLKIGEKIGHKFKPWEAVNFAKKIGNAAMFIGPVLDGVAMGVDIKGAKEIEKAKLECRKMFLEISSDLKKEYNDEFEGIYDFYDEALSSINEKRIEAQNMIQSNNEINKVLMEFKNELTDIGNKIYNG